MESHQHNNRYHNETHQQDNKQCCDAQPFCSYNEVVISIQEKIQKLPLVAEECCIYRVPKRLFNMNPSAYTPKVISIGPFHHGKEDFVDMERHKIQFLDFYLRHTNICLKDAFDIARTWEEQARRCYAEPINMNSEKFVEMMLVDACFIVEYAYLFKTDKKLVNKYYSAISLDIYRDLTMLENQLPFFILQSLFDKLLKVQDNVSLSHLAHPFLSNSFLRTDELQNLGMIPIDKVRHLLDLLSLNLVPLSSAEDSESKKSKSMLLRIVTKLCCLACVKIKKENSKYKYPPTVTELREVGVKIKEDNEENNKYSYPPTVTELREVGVKIKKAAKEKHFMDISFKNGVLEIPHFEIDDSYETIVRNIMAYEHCNVQSDRKYVIQYISFLDYLISSKEDVRILVKKGIITNNIGGSNKEVTKLFNNLCKEVIFPYKPLRFNKINQDLHKYREKQCNPYMASLRHNYCSTPWATISIIAAISLLILSFLQTLFSILSFQKN